MSVHDARAPLSPLTTLTRGQYGIGEGEVNYARVRSTTTKEKNYLRSATHT